MPRGSWRKRWIKLYVTGWLHGSIRWQFTSEERGVWADLLAWAGEIQRDGAICDNDGRALPRDFMANALNIKQVLLDRVIAKSIHEGRLEEKEGVLVLTNYEAYQSEYERQKPYRHQSQELQPELQHDTETLAAYIEQLRPEFSDLDLDAELVKFNLYWSEGSRKLKRPKLALRNWLTKAREIKGKDEEATAPRAPKRTTAADLKASITKPLR